MNIVITGASKGIGRALAIRFSQEHKVLALSRNKDMLEQLHLENKTNISYLPFDICDFDKDNLLEKINHMESIDVLLNNAGVLINKPFLETETEDFKKIYDVNVFGVANLVKVLYPKLEKANNAHIVNIGSMGGFQGSSKFAGLSVYSSSKAALANLTECLAEEFKATRIKCNCLCLGAVNTEMLQNAFPGYEAQINSSEIAEFIYDFSVNGNKYFNGKIVPVALNNP